jgi:hypothetical protein
MRFRFGRFAKAQWRAVKRAYRQHIGSHRWVVIVGLQALVGGSLVLATLPGRHSQQSPQPSAARPLALPASSSGPIAPPEKPAQSARPTEDAALRPPPALPPPPVAKPAWLRFAVPTPPSGNRPLVAIVFDDLGLDRARTAEAIRLRGPLTMSFMTYANDLGEQTEAARRAGHELFLHVPMEAIDRHADPGPRGLFTAVARENRRGCAGARPRRRHCRDQQPWAANLPPMPATQCRS